MHPSSLAASVPKPRIHWRYALTLLMVPLAGWLSMLLLRNPPGTLTFANGMQITYTGFSQGRSLGPQSHPMYQHPSISAPGHFVRRTAWFYWMAGITINRPASTYPWELHFKAIHLKGNLPLQITVADDEGWESSMPDPETYLRDQMLWIDVAGPLPQHSRNLHIRFYDSAGNQKNPAHELTIANPVFLSLPPAPISITPQTQALADGEVRLEKIHRPRQVGAKFDKLNISFSTLRQDHLTGEIALKNVSIATAPGTDYGEFVNGSFFSNSGKWTWRQDWAPWGTDREWIVRVDAFQLTPPSQVPEENIVRFTHIPARATSTQVVQWKSKIEMKFVSPFSPRPPGKPILFDIVDSIKDDHPSRWIVYRAQDDQGRTEYPPDQNDSRKRFIETLFATPSRFALSLPQDAVWWDLELIQVPIFTVEFHARPELHQ